MGCGSSSQATVWNVEALPDWAHSSGVRNAPTRPTPKLTILHHAGSDAVNVVVIGGETHERNFVPSTDKQLQSNRVVKAVNNETGSSITLLHPDPVHIIAGHPTLANILATGSYNKEVKGGDVTVRVWDTATGECTATLLHTDPMHGRVSAQGWPASSFSFPFLSWHPSRAHILATASNNNTPVGFVRVWDTTTGECTATLRRHNYYSEGVCHFQCLAWHPLLPNILATGTNDRYVNVWDVATGEAICSLMSTRHTVASIFWHPFLPHTFATLSSIHDPAASVWDLKKPLRNHLCAIEQAFELAHPLAITTLAGDTHTLVDWCSCKDLKTALSKLAPDAVGNPNTFELLSYLGALASESNHLAGGILPTDTPMQVVDGKHGSDDRWQMIFSKDFDCKLVLVCIGNEAAFTKGLYI